MVYTIVTAWKKYYSLEAVVRLRNEDQVFGSGDDGYDNANVMMAMSVEELLDWVMNSGSSYYITYRRDYLVYYKEYDGDNILLGDGRECRVRGTVGLHNNVRRVGVDPNIRCVVPVPQQNWEDHHINILVNKGHHSSRLDLRYARVCLGFLVAYIVHRRYGMLEPVKVKCIFLEYRKGVVGNKALKEKANNEAAFAVAVVEKIYAHESLTFNNIVDCELIFKWKAGLKDDMDSRDLGYQRLLDKAKGNIPLYGDRHYKGIRVVDVINTVMGDDTGVHGAEKKSGSLYMMALSNN
ncbi:hypothetical protein Tco_0067529 [Tanacetum coccineum]